MSTSSKKHLIKAAGIVGLMTLASRVLGMIRDVVSAQHFGTTWQWDAFIFAFALPMFLRRLVGEGALASAFIPVYSETREKQGEAAAFRFASVAGSMLSGCLAIFIAVIFLLLEIVLQFKGIPERLYLTLDLLRYFFPYLWFISLTAWTMGILNSHRNFFSPAMNPVIFDIFWIGGVFIAVSWFGGVVKDQLHGLAWIIFVSGVVQLAIQIPALRRTGFRFRWLWDSADAGLKKTMHLLLPAILSFAVVQINVLVDSACAFLIGPGANSALWYGNRLMQFPLGLFAIAMGTALLPSFSTHVARGETEQAGKTMSFALRSVFLIILPCTVGLMVMSRPIIQMLFQRGEFDATSTARTAAVLFYYALGLFAHSGQKIVATGFYASQDTRTPVKIGVIALVSNIVGNLILMQFLAEAGLALSTSLAGILQFGLLLYFYHRKVGRFPFAEVGSSFIRILAASLAMGAICFYLFWVLGAQFPGSGLSSQLIRVLGSIGISTLAYVALCFLFRVPEAKEALDWVRKKKSV